MSKEKDTYYTQIGDELAEKEKANEQSQRTPR